MGISIGAFAQQEETINKVKAEITISDVTSKESTAVPGYMDYTYTVTCSDDIVKHAVLVFDTPDVDESKFAEYFASAESEAMAGGKTIYNNKQVDEITEVYYYNKDLTIIVSGITAEDTIYATKQFLTVEKEVKVAEVTLTIEEVTDTSAQFTVEFNNDAYGFFLACYPLETLEDNNWNSLDSQDEVWHEFLKNYQSGQLSAFPAQDETSNVMGLTKSSWYGIWVIPFNNLSEQGKGDYKEFKTLASSVDLASIDMTSVNIYPNPATEKIVVSSLSLINSVELVNVLGQVVYSSNIAANGYNIPVADFEKGTYFLKARCADKVLTQKVIIK